MRPYIKIQQGQQIQRDVLIEDLFRFNYRQDTFVMQQGEFAVRGNIIDIYPFNFRSPVRVEFDFDEITSLRGFLVEKQDMLETYTELIILPVRFMQQMHQPQTEEFYDAHLKMRTGDYVVHVNYGVGKYVGMRTLKVKGEAKKFLVIEYQNNELLYVEADGPPLLERYIGCEGKKPKLHKLRTKEWERLKARTRLAVKNVARDMIRLEAKRNTQVGYACQKDGEWQASFENEFPYEETPDQIRAWEEVRQDMEVPRPMDRLVCGDVGYGKTEVAMRAAFKALMSNKQVAMLVPTTILAEQHFLSFKKRVKSFPITVGCLSRFKTAKEQKEIVAQVKDGACDIVIGTHRLLSDDVSFKDLGLVIIDEEQRFGVRHKEKLKHYRHLVDILTLTATPIPRTLYMSLIGVRDISMINTPPKSRLPIETEVCAYDQRKVTKAVEREMARRGQIFFVHNRVQSIKKIHTELKKNMPTVRFAVAHGQMPAHTLEEVMTAFFRGEVDCLISTNIIESGIDIPNVNTIIVNRADAFGLSDLYQLRGRVGRFQKKRKAYALFLYPRNFVMTSDAEKRLEAIRTYTELGAGLKIALEDLEIRGAGNLLGHEQSGFIYQVGFDLYCKLLREAIRELHEAKRAS